MKKDELLNHWQKLPRMKEDWVRILFTSGRTNNIPLAALGDVLEDAEEKPHDIFFSQETWDTFVFVAMQQVICAQWELRNIITDADTKMLTDMGIAWDAPEDMTCRGFLDELKAQEEFEADRAALAKRIAKHAPPGGYL
jgi:hypothetical protein